MMLATGLIVAYAYIIEAFTAWYSGNVYEAGRHLAPHDRPYAVAYWALITCNIVAPQSLWFKRVRSNPCCCSSGR